MWVFTPHSDQEQSVTAEATEGTEFTAMDQDGLIFLYHVSPELMIQMLLMKQVFISFFAMRKPICFS